MGKHEGAYGGDTDKASAAQGVAEMNSFEITELAQIREQETMRDRAERQALGRARREADRGNGAGLRPRAALGHRLVAFFGARQSATALASQQIERCAQSRQPATCTGAGG